MSQLLKSSIPCFPDEYNRCLHLISSSTFAIGRVTVHILKQLYKLSSVLQSTEGPLSMNEGLASLFLVSLARSFTEVGRLTPVSSVGLSYWYKQKEFIFFFFYSHVWQHEKIRFRSKHLLLITLRLSINTSSVVEKHVFKWMHCACTRLIM